MTLPNINSVKEAIGLYNEHARDTGQPTWPEDTLETFWWRDCARYEVVLSGLSPIPRAGAEETLLSQLMKSLVIERVARSDPDEPEQGPDAQDLMQRQLLLTRLSEMVDWSAHGGGWDTKRPRSLAYRLLDEAISFGTFDMAFPVLSPHLRPTDEEGRHSLVFSILTEMEMGNPMAVGIQTDLKQVGSPETFDHLMLWGMLQLVRHEPQHYGAIWPLADSSRTLPAQSFRERERADILQSEHLTTEGKEEALQALDYDLSEMVTHPWLSEHHQRLYEAFRAVRPHVAEHVYLSEDRQQRARGAIIHQGSRPRRRV